MELERFNGKDKKEASASPKREVAYTKLMRSSWRANRPWRPSTTSVGSQGRNHLTSPIHQAILQRDIPEVERILKNSVGDFIDSFDDEGMAPLHQAAKHGLSDVISLLVDHGASINLRNQEGSTALNISLRFNREGAAMALIDNGIDVNLIDTNGQNALHIAAKESQAVVLGKILETSAVDVNAQDAHLNTALHYATAENDVECCKILIESNAQLDIANETGEMPLHISAGENYLDIIELLIETRKETLKTGEKGANSVENYINKPRNDKKTALLLAAEMGYITAMNKLIDEGADIFMQTSTKTSLLHLTAAAGDQDSVNSLLKKGLSCNIPDSRQRTPLHEAVRFGHLAIVGEFLDAKADISMEDNEGHTPFLLAAKYSHIRVASLLLNHGAKPTAKDTRLKTALHYAVENGNLELAAFLVEKYKKLIHAKDDGSHTPVHYAARSGDAKFLKLFKKHTKQLYESDNIGETALHVAARYGNVSFLNELSDHSENTVINCTNPQGQTPLHIAVINKQLAASKVLLKHKADVNCQDENNWTPLHHASSQENATAVRLLLKHRAEIDLEDIWGSTPLMVAAKAGNVLGVVMLLQHGASIEATNQDGDTFFDLAIDFQQEMVCKAILENDRWKEILSCKDPHGRNYMSKLIEKSPHLAEVILDRSTVFSDHHPEHPDFSVTFNYQFIEEKPKSHSLMNDAITIFTKQRNMLYFAPELMAKYGRESLMAHPITANLFATKWHRICRYFYYLSFMVYLIYVVSMSILILMENRTYLKVIEYRYNNKSSSNDFKGILKDSPSEKKYGKILGSLILAFCAFQILKELVQLVVLRDKYFKSFNNYVEVCLYSVNVYYIVSFFSLSIVTRELSEVGVICIFLAWTNLLLYLQRVAMFRLYIVMFIKVSFTIIKLLVVFAIIILAFALTFYLLFIRQTSFRSPLASTAKVLVMMTGEFDFDDAISSKLGQRDPKTGFPYVPFPALSYVVFVIFVFLVAVAFTNLLIGLAVGDIDEIRKIATVSIFEQQLEFIDSIQGIVPKYILKKRVYIPENTYFVNRKTKLQIWKQALLPDSTDENLKKLRMEQLDFDTRRIPAENFDDSRAKNDDCRRQKLVDDLLMEQQKLLQTIIQSSKKDAAVNAK